MGEVTFRVVVCIDAIGIKVLGLICDVPIEVVVCSKVVVVEVYVEVGISKVDVSIDVENVLFVSSLTGSSDITVVNWCLVEYTGSDVITKIVIIDDCIMILKKTRMISSSW